MDAKDAQTPEDEIRPSVHFLELKGWSSNKLQEKRDCLIPVQLKGLDVFVPIAPLAPFGLNGSEYFDAPALIPPQLEH